MMYVMQKYDGPVPKQRSCLCQNLVLALALARFYHLALA